MPEKIPHDKRLSKAVRWSRDRMEVFRTRRRELVELLVGAHYSDNGSDKRQPINLLDLASTIYKTQLAANAPRVLCTTRHESLESSAVEMELGLNHLLENEIDFETTTQRWVDTSLTQPFGIMHVRLISHGKVEIEGDEPEAEGFWHDYGQPNADVIDFDDFVLDMDAKRWDQVQFVGHRYRADKEALKESGRFDPDKIEKLKPYRRDIYNEDGDERTETISRGDHHGYDDTQYRDTVELWDIWIPAENKIYTYEATQDFDSVEGSFSGEPVGVEDWYGPEGGPYHLLMLQEVSGQIMGLPPAAGWRDLHELVNTVYRKLGRQAERQKEVGVVPGHATEDGETVINANDGDLVKTNSPGQVAQMKFGGIDQTNHGFVVDAIGRFSWMAGNLDSLGGLSPQAETATQDKLISKAANQRIASMQKRVYKATRKAVEALAWYLFYDPLIELPITKQVRGTGRTLQTTYESANMEGDFLQYNIKIEMYSMQDQTPGSRLEMLQMVVGNLVMPMMEQMMQQGMSLDMPRLLSLVSRYANMPEVENIIVYAGADQMHPDPVGTPPAKMANTTRTYERRNVPSANRQGADNAMIQQLMGGGGVQPAQASNMGPR